jgi:uncharacterized membrane protein
MMQPFSRHIIAGVLTIIPLGVTVWIVWFIFDVLIWLGRPATLALARALRPTSPQLSDLLQAGWFQSAIAFVVALVLLAVVLMLVSGCKHGPGRHLRHDEGTRGTFPSGHLDALAPLLAAQ